MRENSLPPTGLIVAASIYILYRGGFDSLLNLIAGEIVFMLWMAWLSAPWLGAMYVAGRSWNSLRRLEPKLLSGKILATLGYGLTVAAAAIAGASLWGLTIGPFVFVFGLRPSSGDLDPFTQGIIDIPLFTAVCCALLATAREAARLFTGDVERVMNSLLLYGGYTFAMNVYSWVFHLNEVRHVMPDWWYLTWTSIEITCLIFATISAPRDRGINEVEWR